MKKEDQSVFAKDGIANCICRFFNTQYCVSKKEDCSQDEYCEQLSEMAFNSLVEVECYC